LNETFWLPGVASGAVQRSSAAWARAVPLRPGRERCARHKGSQWLSPGPLPSSSPHRPG
jgi:hypothetical protein